ncbi:MAG: alpha/beta hydrolase domain-containing protein [Halioglobus sp.]
MNSVLNRVSSQYLVRVIGARAHCYRFVQALFLGVVLVGCSDGSDGSDSNGSDDVAAKPQPDNPEVTGPISGGGADTCCALSFFGIEVDLRDQGYVPGTPFYSGLVYDVTEVGYTETEYFITGSATAYSPTQELTADGVWPVQAADTADYVSRIVVLRPSDAAAFNGTVVVEWLNVSGGLDAAPDWLQTHRELVREGYAWVGVSAQAAGIEGGGAFDLPLKQIDPERYNGLNHPGDSYSYDIFSQAAQAVRNPQGMDPLDGLRVERMLAVGESQSAFRLVTYINAIHPMIELFDGFLVHSRGGSAAALTQEPLATVDMPDPAFIRTDGTIPVLTLQTETDVFRLNSIVSRQEDSDYFRLWEVAGSAHSDIYTTLKSPMDRGNDPTLVDVVEEPEVRPPFISCTLPANDGPGPYVARAAIAALDQWARNGEAAPSAPLLSVDAAQTSFEYDALGNVLGGIRTPWVDAPVAVLSGEGQPSTSAFCGLFGTTMLFDADMLSMQYPTQQAYIDAIDSATDDAVAKGFLRPADGEIVKSRARTSGIGAP